VEDFFAYVADDAKEMIKTTLPEPRFTREEEEDEEKQGGDFLTDFFALCW